MSSHPQMFRQCELKRGGEVIVAWIPEQFAKIGKRVDLREDHGWDAGWMVVAAYSRVAEEYVREHERDYKSQREASDI